MQLSRTEKAVMLAMALQEAMPFLDSVGVYGEDDPYLVAYVTPEDGDSLPDPWHTGLAVDDFPIYVQATGSIPPLKP